MQSQTEPKTEAKIEREGFVFYRSFYEAIKGMEDSLCAACFRALCAYGLNGEIETTEPIPLAILTMAKPYMDKNNQRYENGKKGAEYGKLGGRPKKEETEKKDEKPQKNPNQTPKETEKEKETGNLKIAREGRAGQPAFTPPRKEEVEAYCKERGNHVDAERFVDYYTSIGWMVGKNKMKDWQAAVRRWEKQEEGKQTQTESPKKKNGFINYPQDEWDFQELERLEREQRKSWDT